MSTMFWGGFILGIYAGLFLAGVALFLFSLGVVRNRAKPSPQANADE